MGECSKAGHGTAQAEHLFCSQQESMYRPGQPSKLSKKTAPSHKVSLLAEPKHPHPTTFPNAHPQNPKCRKCSVYSLDNLTVPHAGRQNACILSSNLPSIQTLPCPPCHSTQWQCAAANEPSQASPVLPYSWVQHSSPAINTIPWPYAAGDGTPQKPGFDSKQGPNPKLLPPSLLVLLWCCCTAYTCTSNTTHRAMNAVPHTEPPSLCAAAAVIALKGFPFIHAYTCTSTTTHRGRHTVPHTGTPPPFVLLLLSVC